MVPADLANTLRNVVNELEIFLGSTEEEFLRLGASLHDFQQRACDITSMAKVVVGLVDSDEIVNGIKSLEQMIGMMDCNQKSSIEKSEKSFIKLRNIIEILDKVDEPLTGFRKINKVLHMLGISTRIESTRLSNGAEGFDNLIWDSVQKQELTRQQMKHVAEAISELCDKIEKQAGFIDPGTFTWNEMLGETLTVCELQTAQLGHASLELSGALENILRNFQGVAQMEGQISLEAKEMAGAADKAGSSFFQQMERNLSGVTELLQRSASENRNILSALERLDNTIGEISSLVESIEAIGGEIELIAIRVNLVGELVTVQARLSQIAAVRNEVDLSSVAEEVERLISEFRDNALSIRMLPIGTTFSKFKRLVHDLSGELGKDIEMTTAGAETELNKNVIEKLNDPLVHLIRNCIDHGIETPEKRDLSGKPTKGNVHLAAVHSGDSVLLSISDDGAGLDREAIRSKAVEKGLIPAGVDLPDKEIYSQIFAPGFSTAKKVASVSGRGVGMDVVKQAIVNIGNDSFVMPLFVVDECVELTRKDVENSHGRILAKVRGQLIPYIPLRERFNIAGEPPSIEQIVITRINDARVGFVVDNVIGEHQTVIKSLGRAYRNVQGLSGATILGNGNVALILDLFQLIREEEMEANTYN